MKNNSIILLLTFFLYYNCNSKEEMQEQKPNKLIVRNDTTLIKRENKSESYFLDTLFLKLNNAGFSTERVKRTYPKSIKKLAHISLLDSSLLINNIGVDRYLINRREDLKSPYEKKIAAFRGGTYLDVWMFKTSKDANYFFSKNENISRYSTPVMISYIYRKNIISFKPRGAKKTKELKDIIFVVENYMSTIKTN